MNTNIKNIKFGWKPDTLDVRDRVLKFGPANDLAGLPTKVDLRPDCSSVESQATLGSCTANAAASALEYMEFKDGLADENFENFSRLFIYYNTREMQNTINIDTGATLRDTIKTLASIGACDELKWPYKIEDFTKRPSVECYEEAGVHKISEYSRLENFSDMLKCLADGFPFVFGFLTYTEFGGPEVAKTGVVHLPTANEICMGGHAVTAVGYDMDQKHVIVRNSWGEEWGQDGYFMMPFSYISNPNLSQDFWTIRR